MHVHDNIMWLTCSLLLHSFPEKERAGQADNQRTVCVYSSKTKKEPKSWNAVRYLRYYYRDWKQNIYNLDFISWKGVGISFTFLNKEELREISKPNCFEKNCFKNLRAIIDCTEFYVEKPGKPSSQRSTYSQYKSSNTFKLLISMSPILHFNFVSKLYSGSISDKEIVNVSGFLEKMNPGDAVMADKGFNIQDLLALHDTVLIAPPMMRKSNVSARASTATRRVATSRVHIERMIRRLKLFNFLRGVIPLTCKPYVSSAVTVCAILVNLQPSIIKEK